MGKGNSGGGGAKSASGGVGSGQVGPNLLSTAAAAVLAATSAVLTHMEEDTEDNMEFMSLGLRQLHCCGIARERGI
eukprot:14019239-Ditylum_brightwellii.AAC.1